MYEEEIIVFICASVLLVLFLVRWYKPIIQAWPPEKNRTAKTIMKLLPLALLIGLLVVLKFFASFDVVDNNVYILFYIVLGYAWVFIGLFLMSTCFGVIWPDDAIYHDNKAALLVIIGEFIAIAAIYAGSNIGDGPGWWCVLFSGVLGLVIWLILGFIYHLCTGIFERVTVERDFGSGCRFCLYLILSGIILGRACSGDWTSFSKTVEEFMIDGWPVLPLTAVMIIIENICRQTIKHKGTP